MGEDGASRRAYKRNFPEFSNPRPLVQEIKRFIVVFKKVRVFLEAVKNYQYRSRIGPVPHVEPCHASPPILACQPCYNDASRR